MERKSVLILVGTTMAVLALLACDAGTFTAFLDSATATPTRTPRPTFTPRPTLTPTPEDTPTPEATPTTAASPTPTQRATVRPATKPPAPPPPPPAPKLEWKQDPGGNQGLCPAGPSVFEVKGKVHDGKSYVGGIHAVALDKNGKIIAQMDSIYPEYLNAEFWVSCFEEKNLVSYQLDVSAGRMNQPFILRLTRSANDLTPISTDVKLEFPADGGRFYINWTK